MVLVDTSVLIDFLKNKKNTTTEKLETIINLNIPFGITGFGYQELLQGTATQKDFDRLKEYLDTLIFYHPADEVESYAAAARIYFQCRKKGITIRSSADCMIAQIALENQIKLLHNDKDFDNIKKIFGKLDFF